MEMEWAEALEIVVARTSHRRYRDLCDPSHPDHLAWRDRMVAMAGPPAYPPPAERAGNAWGAASRVVSAFARGEHVFVDEAEQARRLATCEGCDRYDPGPPGRCKACGCVAAWKARLATEHCPLLPPKW